jgi:ABC-2 type transport system ATP-binding protein
MRQFADEGRTVLVSSHILSEIEHICDRVAILSTGRCVAQGTVHDVLASAGASEAMLVKVEDLDAGLAALRDGGIAASRLDDALRVDLAPDEAERVSRTLAARDLFVTELRPDEVDLETVFLELTRDPEAPS